MDDTPREGSRADHRRHCEHRKGRVRSAALTHVTRSHARSDDRAHRIMRTTLVVTRRIPSYSPRVLHPRRLVAASAAAPLCIGRFAASVRQSRSISTARLSIVMSNQACENCLKVGDKQTGDVAGKMTEYAGVESHITGDNKAHAILIATESDVFGQSFAQSSQQQQQQSASSSCRPTSAHPAAAFRASTVARRIG
jgi:hypothetical protein